MRHISYILLVMLMISCQTQRRIGKTHIRRHETGRRVITIPKDSVIYRPKVIYKDTTIVVENKQVVLKTKYAQGKIIRVVCEQKPKQITETYERNETVKEKDRQLERSGFMWDDKYVLWFFGFVMLLMIVNKILNKLL